MGTADSPGARHTAPPVSSASTGAPSTGTSRLPDPHWIERDYQWCLLCDLKAVDPEDTTNPILCPSCQARVG